MTLMKIYASDPLARLLAVLWARSDRSLTQLLDEVARQFYLAPCSLVARAYRIAAGSTGLNKEAS